MTTRQLVSRQLVKDYLRRAVERTGFEVTRRPGWEVPAGMDALATIRESAPYTLTDQAKVFGLIQGVRYVVRHRIPGDIVECGVWAGGSTMAAARTLLELGDTSRHLYLFDTFEGMSAPTDLDVAPDGQTAAGLLSRSDRGKADSAWCVVSIDEVRANVARIGYPADQVHFIQGKVEDTVPEHAPEQIALLRLDTDWYESTRHEMEHLYPRTTASGVLIIDDYGWWKGAQQAVDEYVAAHELPLLLNRLGPEGGAIGIVPAR
ncbi:TylF/MycF/NovP-related O-methyltransferase [Candidatus Frankia nodulisporulans]|uniref:TylF/MycF/NovP-related O-methyltransferase n=1 Tax=Candidatus Frankia nodulisporulans TaxID=2060052 RepID=UPI0013D08CC0|nr:TylF/MycF/NovP-related O-methyltransferase [Candidatus Frankia nodulisporulans]